MKEIVQILSDRFYVTPPNWGNWKAILIVVTLLLLGIQFSNFERFFPQRLEFTYKFIYTFIPMKLETQWGEHFWKAQLYWYERKYRKYHIVEKILFAKIRMHKNFLVELHFGKFPKIR